MLLSSYVLRLVVLQLLAYGAYRWLLGPTRLHRVKRAYLLLAPVAAAVVPLLVVRTELLPVVAEVAAVLNAAEPAVTAAAPVASTSGFGWGRAAAVVYALGVAAGLLGLLRALVGLRRQRRRATAVYVTGGARWYALPEPTAVYSFGRAVYYCIHNEPSAAVRAHELAHVRQLHSIDRLWLRLLRIVGWFSPGVWLFERAAAENHELLADAAAVLALGVPPLRYQLALLRALTGRGGVPSLGSGLSFSFTKHRFAMLNPTPPSPGRNLLRLGLMALLWGCLLHFGGRTVYAQTPAPAPKAPAAQPLPPPPPPPPPLLPPPPPPPPPGVHSGALVLEAVPDGLGPGEVPCAPPPPVTLSTPDLDRTLAQYYADNNRRRRRDNPDCIAWSVPKKQDPSETLRDLLIRQYDERLEQLRTTPTISAGDYQDYLNADKYGVWLDGERVANDLLERYGAAGLYRYVPPALLLRNAKNYGKHTFHLQLKTKAQRDRELAEVTAAVARLRG